jgi:serine/threonine protein kinase
VKPENCILVREGDHRRLKLVDLGLAKVTREGLLSRPPWSVAGRVFGSFHDLSSEQVLGEDVDARSTARPRLRASAAVRRKRPSRPGQTSSMSRRGRGASQSPRPRVGGSYNPA